MLDQVKGYAGMRKIALCKSGPDSPLRTCLNNQPILQIGLLDQARPIILLMAMITFCMRKVQNVYRSSGSFGNAAIQNQAGA